MGFSYGYKCMAPSVVHVYMTKCNRAALTVVITGRNLSLMLNNEVAVSRI